MVSFFGAHMLNVIYYYSYYFWVVFSLIYDFFKKKRTG